MRNLEQEQSEQPQPISTREFIQEIIASDPRRGKGLHIYTVEFDAEHFVSLINHEDSPYKILPSSDGPIATVQETASDTSQPVDFSHQSRFFDLHKDGLYYTHVPPLALLHCKDPGTEAIPTFFVDTRQIVEQLTNEELERLDRHELVYNKKDGTEHIRLVVLPHTQTGESVITLGSTRTYIRPKEEYLPTISSRDTARVMHKVFELADTAMVHEHTWGRNDLVIFDNERYVHGRGVSHRANAEVQDTRRELTRVWLAKK
jgi:alpha-ketoglutarate-dependent taurine dioxygenase